MTFPDDSNNGNLDSRTLLTITGESAKIEGDFVITDSIEIDCEVNGKLEVDGRLIIRRDGYVNADVKTIDAEIIGKYEGNMEASGNVEIKETGIIDGNLKTDSLIINMGGIFSGNVTRMSEGEEEEAKEETEVETPVYQEEETEVAEEEESEIIMEDEVDEEGDLSL